MLKSSLCDYSDANILVSGIITTDGEGAYYPAKRLNETEKRVIFKSCAPFTDCISEIDNTQIDNSKDIDVMTMRHLIQYSNNYSKTSWSLWQNQRDEPNDNIANSESIQFKLKKARKTPDNDNKNNNKK